MPSRARTRLGIASVVLLAITFAASACVDTSSLAGGGQAPCPAGQQRLDGRCVDAPDPEPVRPDGTCKQGLQDNDKDGICEASCASAALACGAHASCDDAKGKATCVCAIGYERRESTCVWLGGVRDPGFQDKPKVWEASGGAVVVPDAAALVDPGVARFPLLATCNGKAFVRQRFPMPTFAASEPFALEVDAKQGVDDENGLALLVGGGFTAYDTIQKTPKLRVCVGERAYGGDIELVVRRLSEACADNRAATEVDRIAMVPDPTCPRPATVDNGDFEGNGGWTPSGVGVAEVATGVGSKGSRAGRLSTTNLCQKPSLRGRMSAPAASVPRAALTFSFKGTSGKVMRVFAGLGDLGDVTGNATFQAAKLCVPDWAKGGVNVLGFLLEDPGGTCADPNPRDFVFDDLAFVSDPTCPETPHVVDGGFEASTTSASSWHIVRTTPFTTEAAVLRNAGAHGGAAHLTLSTGQACAAAYATQTVTVPHPTATAGPALKLWYRQPGGTRATFGATLAGKIALPATQTWQPVLECLPPERAGQPMELRFEANGGAGTCADQFFQERLDVDDVELTTDATCPR